MLSGLNDKDKDALISAIVAYTSTLKQLLNTVRANALFHFKPRDAALRIAVAIPMAHMANKWWNEFRTRVEVAPFHNARLRCYT